MFRSTFFSRRFAAHCALVAVFASVVPAFAGETIYFQGTAKSRYADTIAVSDITNANKWGISEFSAENDYVIDGGRYCGFGGTGSFPGQSLTLGSVGGTAGYLKNNFAAGTYSFGNLTLNKGVIYIREGSKTISASITVNSASDSPFNIILGASYNNRLYLEGSIKGSGHLTLGNDEAQNDEYSKIYVGSDMTDFTGRVLVGLNGYARGLNRRSVVYFKDVSIGGELAVNPSGYIVPSGTADNYGEINTKRLSFADTGTFRFSVNDTTGGTIRVTESLTLPASGHVNLEIGGLPAHNFSERRHPIIIAPANSGMSEDKFVIEGNKAILGIMEACHLEVDDTSPDCEILYLVMGKYTCLKSSDDWTSSCWETRNSAHWSGVAANTPLDPDMVYIGHSYQIVTPGGGLDPVFRGKRLVFSYTDRAVVCATDGGLRVDDLVMMQGSYFYFWSLMSPQLYGNLKLTKPTNGFSTRMYQGNGYDAYIHSNISGDGSLHLYGGKGGSSISAIANFYLYGTNTAFAGKLCVTNAVNSALTNTTLLVADARSLGGPMPSFTYDGIDFSKWSRLRVTNSLALTEPTRGVFFSGGNYVHVQGAANELTLASQTTLAGTLVKEGAGTLALGGALKFTSAQSDTPSADMNVLQVTAGRIRPVSKGGADGLAISFASGTGLRLAPLAEADEDVRQYGLYDVKWETPFDLSETDGKLDVALDLPESADDIPDNFAFGVCTVASSAAGALDGNINLPKISRRTLTVTQESNGDNIVTFTARYSKRGFSISFR